MFDFTRFLLRLVVGPSPVELEISLSEQNPSSPPYELPQSLDQQILDLRSPPEATFSSANQAQLQVRPILSNQGEVL